MTLSSKHDGIRGPIRMHVLEHSVHSKPGLKNTTKSATGNPVISLPDDVEVVAPERDPPLSR